MSRVVLNLKMPDQVRSDYKVACAHQKTTMQEATVDMIRRYIKREKEQRKN